MGAPLKTLTLTNNRTRIVSAQPRQWGAGLDVRIHRCFVHASETTLQAVADFLLSRPSERRRREALRRIREHFQSHKPLEHKPSRRTILRTEGRFFDLEELRNGVNHQYFDGALQVDITWGRAPSKRRRRRGAGFSIRLGSYNERDNLIRIHRCLDQQNVPKYVIESVVHHEMLHVALPPVIRNGRRYVHTAEFRQRERQYLYHDQACRWIDRHLETLAGLR